MAKVAVAQDDRYITVREASEYLSCSAWFVYRLVRDGELPAKRLNGRAIRVRKTDVEALLKVRTQAEQEETE